MLKRCFFVMLCLLFSFNIYQTVSAEELLVLKTLVRVNFRTGPSTDYDVIDTLDFGTYVLVNYSEEDEDGWSHITYNDIDGYIKSEFIGTEEEYLEAEALLAKSRARTVELVEWSTAKNIFTVGVAVEVYDIYTGLTYYVKSFSNGLHADIEPVTKEDTAIMKRTFGNVWSWDVRPVWVTINGRTMAASINGMPHGGGVNNSNGMNGQVCLHFLGSTTHNGNRSFAKLHQDFVHIAYNLSK